MLSFFKKNYRNIIAVLIIVAFLGFVLFINLGNRKEEDYSNRQEFFDSIEEKTDINETTEDKVVDGNKEPIEEQNNKNSINKKEIISANKEYYCYSNDYTLQGDKCVSSFEVNAINSYYCETFTIRDGKCLEKEKIEITPEEKYGSNDNYTYYSSNCLLSGGTVGHKTEHPYYYCYITKDVWVDIMNYYYCAEGYELIGDKCVYYIYDNALYKYTCPSGYTLKTDICERN